MTLAVIIVNGKRLPISYVDNCSVFTVCFPIAFVYTPFIDYLLEFCVYLTANSSRMESAVSTGNAMEMIDYFEIIRFNELANDPIRLS